ncbi:hypothetical protein BN871_HF_00060 [Paenibacillus sp. P22]|nr:hypothetical protein BN871_HF_00060 [Paenibacillus sp. P22]
MQHKLDLVRIERVHLQLAVRGQPLRLDAPVDGDAAVDPDRLRRQVPLQLELAFNRASFRPKRPFNRHHSIDDGLPRLHAALHRRLAVHDEFLFAGQSSVYRAHPVDLNRSNVSAGGYADSGDDQIIPRSHLNPPFALPGPIVSASALRSSSRSGFAARSWHPSPHRIPGPRTEARQKTCPFCAAAPARLHTPPAGQDYPAARPAWPCPLPNESVLSVGCSRTRTKSASAGSCTYAASPGRARCTPAPFAKQCCAKEDLHGSNPPLPEPARTDPPSRPATGLPSCS